MNQQTVYQTVSVQDELPERVGEYYVRVEDYKAVGILDGGNFYADDKNLHATHWEKPTTGYFFTPEEFERVIKAAMTATANGVGFRDFYNQLTESK